jgi:hypothetical protein
MSPTLTLTSEEVAKATEYLHATRRDLIQAVSGLNARQWHFKPDPERWSIAETLEHMVIVEGRVHGILGRIADAPAADPTHNSSEMDAKILAAVPSREARFQAPEHLHPGRQMSPEEILARFEAGRARTLELLTAAPCLRGHVIPHPILGPWDGYQWILGAGGHSARHTAQIEEIKASPGFPGN